MRAVNSHHPLVRLTQSINLPLFLTQEELKPRKLFRILQKAGLNEYPYQPHLDKLILCSIGLDDDTDEPFERHSTIMQKRCKKLGMDRNAAMKQAFKPHQELIIPKQNRQTR